MNEQVNELEPAMDTGEWKKEVRRMLKELLQRQAEEAARYAQLCAQVQRVADSYDADHKERETLMALVKRFVMAIVYEKGWVKK